VRGITICDSTRRARVLTGRVCKTIPDRGFRPVGPLSLKLQGAKRRAIRTNRRSLLDAWLRLPPTTKRFVKLHDRPEVSLLRIRLSELGVKQGPLGVENLKI
jgi:hypothetical protein